MRYKLAFVILLAFLTSAVTAIAQSTATVNFGTTFQTIRGFGGATAWMPALSSTQANTLFGNGANQLGLTILRSRIDPSSTRRCLKLGHGVDQRSGATALGAIAIATP